MKKDSKSGKEETKKIEEFPLPVYSEKEDIYNKEKKVGFKETDEAGEKILKTPHNRNAEDLEVPGAELDDADEEIGEEDEENNYYSLGGDRHEDLEEDK
jgi:hypothetical protein